ncbi:MAG: hypothetical protein KAJ55_10835 [Anaerolineales bacterium]|nr:hypothetical protein [Anaerolineales bacterium]
MARYRVNKKRDGTYSLMAEIRLGRELIYAITKSNVSPTMLVDEVVALAGKIGDERVRREMVPSRTDLPGVVS